MRESRESFMDGRVGGLREKGAGQDGWGSWVRVSGGGRAGWMKKCGEERGGGRTGWMGEWDEGERK